MVNIIKRDGRVVPFDFQKITQAVCKAMEATPGGVDLEIANNIAMRVTNVVTDRMSVEDIQDQVEHELLHSIRPDAAQQYILYRAARTRERNKQSRLIRTIGDKLSAKQVQNQNANVDEHSFGGRKGEAASELMRQYALDYCVSKMARENHLSNRIYIHDLDSYAVGMHNCLSIPFDDLLKQGFNTRQTDVRPANSINTAFQLVAVIFQLQSLQQFGGCSATHLDWTMVPYVRKSFYKHYVDGVKFIEKHQIDYSFHNELPIDADDYKAYSEPAYQYAMDMTERELKQAVEGMYHNLNVWATKQ